MIKVAGLISSEAYELGLQSFSPVSSLGLFCVFVSSSLLKRIPAMLD